MFENERNIFDNGYPVDLKDENGNSFIEATFVFTTALFLIALIIMFGFFYYQEVLLQTVADEVSTSISRTYPYELKDPATGYIERKNLADQGLMESSYWCVGSVGFFNDSKNHKEEQEAEKLVKRLLSDRRLMAASGGPRINVEIGHSGLAAFQNEVKVTVSEDYYIPFASFFGIKNSTITVSKSSRSLCYDVIGAEGYYQTIMEFADLISKNNVGNFWDNLSTIIQKATEGGKNIAKLLFGGF